MKKQLVLVSSLAIITAGALIMSLTSCSKTSTPNPNAQFLGTYVGQTNYNNNNSPDSVVITAGSNSSSIVIAEQANAATYTATVSGDSITIPAQNVSINTGSVIAVSVSAGSGILSGSNLSLGAIGTYTSSKANFVFNFQGAKK